jgi:hypothetical protein
MFMGENLMREDKNILKFMWMEMCGSDGGK